MFSPSVFKTTSLTANLSFLWTFLPSNVTVDCFLTLIPASLWFSLFILLIFTVAPAKSIPTVLLLGVPITSTVSKVTSLALSTAIPICS